MISLVLQKESYPSIDTCTIAIFLEDSSGKSFIHLAPFKCVSLVYCFNQLWYIRGLEL